MLRGACFAAKDRSHGGMNRGSGQRPRTGRRGLAGAPRCLLRGQRPLPRRSRYTVGAVSGRERGDADWRVLRGVCFAAKDRSHGDCGIPWERSAAANGATRIGGCSAVSASRPKTAPTRYEPWERSAAANGATRIGGCFAAEDRSYKRPVLGGSGAVDNCRAPGQADTEATQGHTLPR